MKVELVVPPPVPRDVQITLLESEAQALKTILSQINDTGLQPDAGPMNKVVRQLWSQLGRAGVPQGSDKIWRATNNPTLRLGI